MNLDRLNSLFDQIDSLISNGKAAEAMVQLRRLKVTAVPPSLRLRYARLARRTGLPMRALRALSPVVRPRGLTKTLATDQENAEYSANLISLGAFNEALKRLESVNSQKVPEALLFTAFAYFGKWEYKRSIPVLESYLRLVDVGSYAYLIGQLNLAPALIFCGEYEEAKTTLDSVLAIARSKKLGLIEGNALQLLAGLYVYQRKLDVAQNYAHDAIQVLQSSQNNYLLLAKKWNAIASFLIDPKDKRKLQQLREEARRLGRWEVLRDCDYFEAITLKTPSLSQHLYFGTPYEAFRARLQQEIPRIAESDHYTWQLGGEVPSIQTFSLAAGASPGMKSKLKRGQALHRLLCALACDFYRPTRVADLHERLFPNDYFNPDSSPVRIHQLVKRLRQWLKASKVNLNISEHEGAYSLSSQSIALVITQEDLQTDPEQVLMNQFLRVFPKGSFTNADVQERLKVSRSYASLLITRGKARGWLYQTGNGRLTRFSCVSPGTSAIKEAA